MISKELLSEVLGKDVDSVRSGFTGTIGSEANIKYRQLQPRAELYINIYELAHKCKEWAFETESVQIIHARKYGYGVGVVKYFSSIEVYNGHYLYNPSDELGTSTQVSFEADTEPEAIFQAAQWVLDNKDKQ